MDTITRHAIRNGVATAAYIAAVAFFMQNVERFVGEKPDVLAGVAVIMLFVTSALITGSLVLWEPAKLLVQGRTADAARQLFKTGATLAAILIAVFIVIILI